MNKSKTPQIVSLINEKEISLQESIITLKAYLPPALIPLSKIAIETGTANNQPETQSGVWDDS